MCMVLIKSFDTPNKIYFLSLSIGNVYLKHYNVIKYQFIRINVFFLIMFIILLLIIEIYLAMSMRTVTEPEQLDKRG